MLYGLKSLLTLHNCHQNLPPFHELQTFLLPHHTLNVTSEKHINCWFECKRDLKSRWFYRRWVNNNFLFSFSLSLARSYSLLLLSTTLDDDDDDKAKVFCIITPSLLFLLLHNIHFSVLRYTANHRKFSYR